MYYQTDKNKLSILNKTEPPTILNKTEPPTILNKTEPPTGGSI